MEGLVVALVIIVIAVLVAILLLALWSQQNNNTDSTTASTNVSKVSDVSATMADHPIDLSELEVYIINLERKPTRFAYVSEQLDQLGLHNYHRWIGTDGFKVDPKEMLSAGVTQSLIDRGLGLSGCATSHIRLWRYIADNNLDWVLIAEDDAHFHPDFVTLFPQYWRQVPADALIVFPGFCAPKEVEDEHPEPVIPRGVMCLHGYMLNAAGAAYLLKELLPMDLPVDIPITEHFRDRPGSYIFNGTCTMDGIRPNDYKEAQGKRCEFRGIIYQNQQDQGSTIHQMETVF
jgi:GR25 family glycosyltransferase involved in LPS biosynthesis